MAGSRDPETVQAIRAALQGRTGRAFWRSLDELAGTPTFRAFLEAEFPGLAPAAYDVDRRSLLKVMAASLALAGLTGCNSVADEAALPYVQAPESVVPGRPKWYATAVTLAGFAQPALGKTLVGRPVKLEGNPDHPATRGATDAFLQAALLGLYDPDRSSSPRQVGRPTSWAAVDAALAGRMAELDRSRGEGFRLLTGAVTSPTLARQIAALLQRWPGGRWHVLEPVRKDLRLEVARRVFGRPLDQHLMLDGAEVVVSLDDDVLGSGPQQAVLARRWSDRRLGSQQGEGECRLLVAEAVPSLTGVMAEDRLVAPARRIGALARAIAAAVGVEGAAAPELSGRERRWVDIAVTALRAHPGRTLLTVGAQHLPEIQALGLLVNERIGAIGTTLRFTEPIAVAPPDGGRSFQALAEDMAAGLVSTLAVIGANPAYAAPADLGFRGAMDKVAFRLHAGTHHDETAALSHWHLPLAHELESWGDARAVDGTASIMQPLVRPFWDVRPLHAVLDGLAGGHASDRDAVQATWRAAWADRFDGAWRDALVRGFVPDSAAPLVAPAVAGRTVSVPDEPTEDGLTVVFRPDPTIWDGRFANNAWLQETPKPLSKATWGNVILVSPQLAAERGIETGDELRLDVGGRAVAGPAWIMPGQEPGTVAVTLGYGRRTGRVGAGLGYDAFAIRRSDRPWRLDGATLAPTGRRETVATTQLHQAMDGFDFVRTVDPSDRDAARQDRTAEPPPSFFPAQHWDSPSWGMAIDLDLCIGCNACVVACVAENNVPVVGKDLVAQGREMHWLRVDRYHEGDPAEPRSYFQPVPCMHCEQAPCEMGCPVNAAVHSADGLNLQVYNRCIGTRTCSSYCPYKVRRFNWFDYTADDPEPVRAMRNPDVTVRSRGVMEKCTYCVQRIARARIQAKVEGRPIRDGEVVTACQQACPTRAITFGDVTDADSAVSRRKADPRNYSLLEEANTRPRTTYLARIERRRTDGGGGDGMTDAAGTRGRYAAVTEAVTRIPLHYPDPGRWRICFGIALLLLLTFFVSAGVLFLDGVGVWGNNIPVNWGLAISNYIWFLGIGHAGTLISAMLLLVEAHWRNALNRFAEAMTLFAVVCAGLYPILHLGRPWFFYWMAPYPSTMTVWPQFKSPLTWDFFAVLTYLTVSILFWYIGIVPDLAATRDRARKRRQQVFYGLLALGWRGSARHWARWRQAYRLTAAIAVPLVISVHSEVSLLFAAGPIPGWTSTVFPPYFVLGAAFSGFAVVSMIAVVMRHALGLEGLVRERHLDLLGIFLLATGLMTAYGYWAEVFDALYSGEAQDLGTLTDRVFGTYAWSYWGAVAANFLPLQLLWFRRVRRNPLLLFLVGLSVTIGMWLERFMLLATSLYRDWLVSSWGEYQPSFWEWSLFAGMLGVFLVPFLAFVRLLPVISAFEIKETLFEEERDARAGPR